VVVAAVDLAPLLLFMMVVAAALAVGLEVKIILQTIPQELLALATRHLHLHHRGIMEGQM
jgi:hypothetical protein